MNNSELWQNLPQNLKKTLLDSPQDFQKELCERNLVDFIKNAWATLEPGTDYVHNWHIDAMAEHLEAISNGEITRLLINVPPGAMKSLLSTVMFPAWEWTTNPHLKYVCASNAMDLATRDNTKTRRLITSEWYQNNWDVNLANDQNAKTNFENSALGFRQASAVRAMTGKRGDRVIWDDPHNIEGALSEQQRETTLRIFSETLPTRLISPEKSAIVIIMQRIHQQDVSGLILEKELGYEHLCLPMEFEPERRCYTGIGFEDPRTEDGELLFPARYSKEVVERDKKAMGVNAVSGQFQQRPSARGGGLFKDEWWQYYKVLPDMDYSIITADTAMKAKEANDFSVLACWGISKKGHAYLIDIKRGKWEAPELEKAFVAFWNKNKHNSSIKLRKAWVEDKASGTGLIQSIKRNYAIPISGIQRKGGEDKVWRANNVTGYIESGYVHLPENAHFISDFIAEHSVFPNGSHDDIVDTTSDGLNILLSKPKEYKVRVI